MRRPLLALVFAIAATSAAAQTQDAPPAPTVSTLLTEGYALVGMQYLTSSIVVMLQRDVDAYICDLTLNGETKICVKLK